MAALAATAFSGGLVIDDGTLFFLIYKRARRTVYAKYDQFASYLDKES